MVSPELQTAETITETMADNVLRLERTLDAPRDIVYRAWTDPVHLAQWWGPEGMSTPNCELDVRPGGKWRTCMMGEGKTNIGCKASTGSSIRRKNWCSPGPGKKTANPATKRWSPSNFVTTARKRKWSSPKPDSSRSTAATSMVRAGRVHSIA